MLVLFFVPSPFYTILDCIKLEEALQVFYAAAHPAQKTSLQNIYDKWLSQAQIKT